MYSLRLRSSLTCPKAARASCSDTLLRWFAVLAVFSESSPEVAKANVDVAKTFTNKFVEQARKTTGMNAK